MSGNLGYYVKYFSELPKEWRTIRLDKNVIDILPGYAFKSHFFEELKGTPLIRVRDIGKDKTEICYNGDFDRKYIVQKNDILIGMDGEYSVSKWNGPKAVLNQRVCKIESLDENFLDNNYLFYVIKKPIKKIETQTPQTTVKHLSTKDIRKIRVPLPPLSEQQKIASILSTVDDAIHKTDNVIGKAEMLKRGLMQRLLTRGIGHTRFKQTELGEIPKTWTIEKGEHLFKIVGGYAPSQINFTEDEDSIELFIKVNDMNNELNQREIVWSENRFHKLENPEIKLFPKGTIVFPKRGAAIFQNRVRILERDATFDPNIMGLICNSRVDIYYFYYLLEHIRLYRLVENAGIPQLNNKQLYPLKFKIPPVSEQKEIASILLLSDERIVVEKRRKKKLEDLKKGLMQVLLTGKVRVKVD